MNRNFLVWDLDLVFSMKLLSCVKQRTAQPGILMFQVTKKKYFPPRKRKGEVENELVFFFFFSCSLIYLFLFLFFFFFSCLSFRASFMAQLEKNLPAMQETWVQSLGWEDLWRREWQPTPVFLPEESPRTEEPGGLQSMGSQRVRHD